jgi:hypothetical protein
MKVEKIDMSQPNAWKKLTRWKRWMISLNDKFKGDTKQIIKHLGRDGGFESELDIDRDKHIKTKIVDGIKYFGC